jgi:6-phosphogluconolactonase
MTTATANNLTTTPGSSTRIADVEEQLNELWAQVADTKDHSAILRATTLNMVLYTNDEQAALTLIGQVSEAHPGRAIVIATNGGQPDSLTAVPTVFCRPSLGSGEARTQVCCEEILITAGSKAIARISGAVQALLLPDLPVYIFREGDALASDPVITSLGELADGLILDSATFGDLPSALHGLAELQARPHFHMQLFDLNWQRLLPWRKALAQAFDGTEDRPLLRLIKEVEIVHHEARAQALLLLGWLASRLDWQLVAGGAGNGDSWTMRNGGGEIVLRLSSADSGSRGLQRVTVKTSRHPVAITLSEADQCLTTADGRALTVRLPPSSVGALVSLILDNPGRDRIFEAAVAVATTLCHETHLISERTGIIVVSDASALAHVAVRKFIQAGQRAIHTNGRFTVALSGGSTPRAIYELLASKTYRDQVAWAKVHVFWGDERDVPMDHQDSNQRMAHETLLTHVSIPSSNIHGIMTGYLPAAEAAARYEGNIRAFFQLAEGQFPTFDLVLLGLGEDGHTASLFPQTEALAARGIFVANPVPQLNTTRLTLTADAINNAANIVFLIAGKAKAEMVHTVFKGKLETDKYPAQRIQPKAGLLTVIVEREAASKL